MNFLADGCITGVARQPGHGMPDTVEILFGKHDRDIKLLANERMRFILSQN